MEFSQLPNEKPNNAGSEYFNYKKFHSIVLQAVVDADGNFIIIDVGDYGSSSDDEMFEHSDFGEKLIERRLNIPPPRQISTRSPTLPYVFVADEAYPLKINIMRPFPQRNLNPEKRIFNYRLSRARRLVECAFGILVKRFRILENVMLLSPENAETIVKACCILHNAIRSKEGAVADIEMELLECQENELLDVFDIRRPSGAAYNIRSHFVNYFNSEGAVPWQFRFL